MEELYEQRNKIISAFLIAAFIGLFNETALNMAFVQLGKDFGEETSTIQWLTTGYLLTLGILVPVSAFLMQRFTTRQLFAASLIFSISGTLISAIAPAFTILLMGRIVQAIGAAIILPLMMNVILLVYPINKRGAAMGKIGLVIIFAPAIGPTIAGVVLDRLTWHWIFWIALPFLVLALLVGLRFVRNVSEVQPGKLDVWSFILSTIGFGGVVYGFSISGELGTFLMPEVMISIGVGVVALILFGVRQLKMERPMLNLRVFKYPMYVIALIILMVCMMAILSTMVILPIYLQNVLLLAPVLAGLVLLPGGIINAFMSVVAGNLFDKFGPTKMVPSGLVIVMISLFFLRGIDATTSPMFIVALHIAMFIGISLVMMPAQTNGLNELPRELYPDGTAIMNTLQQVSGAVGTAVAVTILSITASGAADPVQGMSDGLQNSITFGLVIAVIALILSFFIKNVREQ
ncbi:DHA2 family efflux MFS transporter permease subunit [Lysinibacillus sp. KU-BSD001]|uniref:DHA2 family efflux MFS transporter permease subunit n=1 Tax=Lysinibacillus sp. KU-BSD001 TaxID=3141328 RepID=UPI0036E7397A